MGNITGHTKLFCLIGSPVDHSGSPAMHNYSFERTGTDAAYLAFDIPLDNIEEGIKALRTLKVGGFNVTMPDKTAVTKYLDDITPAARLIGACNTVTADAEGKLTGHNTDGIGFVRNLKENGISVKGQKITLLGAGGAATAIAVQTALDGAAELHIFNREDEFYPNAELTLKKLTEEVPSCKVTVEKLENAEALKEAIAGSTMLVNATKVGMAPLDGQTLIDTALLRKDLIVADTVYNPRETKLILDAKEAGCKAAIGGIGMLLWQGAEAFHLYTGKDMPTDEVMEKFFS